MSRPSAREVFSQRASRYVTSATHADPGVLARVAGHASIGEADRALDVGTGTGHTAFALAETGATVIGLDLTPQMIQQARRHSPQTSRITFVQGDAHSLPFPDASMDAITCRRTAHHFADVPDALGEMFRVLLPGGRLVIDDRSIPEDDDVDRFVNDLDRIHDPSHVRDYRESEWRSYIEGCRYEITDVSPYTQHRPLAEYIQGIETERGTRMEAALSGAPEGLQKKLGLDRAATAYTHWFLTVAARKPADA